jgi:uncharacterized membrane protein
MTTYVRLFLISALFGAAIAVAYYFIAHEETVGTILLAIMTAALVFCASYALLAERHAEVEGDDPDETAARAAGEDLGIFTKESAWPVLIAVCALCTITGLLWAPLMGALAFAALLLCLWRLGAESARI